MTRLRLRIVAAVAMALVACFDVVFADPKEPNSPTIVGEKVEQLWRQGEKLKRQIEKMINRALPKSILDAEDIEAVAGHVEKLKGMTPTPLAQMNTMPEIRKIASGGDATGELKGSHAEKARLAERRDLRAKEIDALKAQREKLSELANSYRAAEDAARKLTQMVGEKMVNPAVEIVMRSQGYSVALTWLELEIELTEALATRANAAADLVKSYDKVIKNAQEDLTSFNESRLFFDFLFSGEVDVSAVDPRTDTNAASLKLQEIKGQMDRQTAEATALANKMRAEALAIRKHNAGISKIQSLLAFIGAAAGTADAVSGKEPPSVTYNHYEQKWETKVQAAPAPTPIRRPAITSSHPSLEIERTH